VSRPASTGDAYDSCRKADSGERGEGVPLWGRDYECQSHFRGGANCDCISGLHYNAGNAPSAKRCAHRHAGGWLSLFLSGVLDR
jgi:hypothetical protein